MGTSFIAVSILKVATFFGVGTGIFTGLSYFVNFKYKPRKKEKGAEEDGKIDNLRKEARSLS